METVLQQLTRGKALLLIMFLGFGGNLHLGYHLTELSSPSPFIQSFINSSWWERYGEVPPPQTVTMIWSLIVSLYAVGGLLGAGCTKFVSGRIGRKKAIILNSLVAMVAALLALTSKVAGSYEMIIVSRILSGVCAGLGLCLHVMYLGEISPKRIRGVVTLTSATFSSLGKLSGQFCGLSEILGREDLWNVLMFIPAFFSLINVAAMPFFPEAPRYLLIEKGDNDGCKKALQKLWGPGDYKEEMDDMMAEQAAIEAAPRKNPLQLLRARNVRWQLITMMVIVGSNQLSGGSAINTFSYDIFLQVGIEPENIRYVTLGLGVIDSLSSIFSGLLLIERTGRRPLICGGYGVMVISWILVTVTLNLQDHASWTGYLSAAFIILFVVAFSGGPVAVTATLNSELFVQSDRVSALVLIGSQRWLTLAILGFIFPFILTSLHSYSFVLFACVSVLGFTYTFLLLPETKGKSILEIAQEFQAITVCGKNFQEKKRTETKL